MEDEVLLGPVPQAEERAKFKVGDLGYRDQAMRECRAYIQAIRRKHGPEPEEAALEIVVIKAPFGTIYEAICRYNSTNQLAAGYAAKCESDAPQTWSEVGMQAPNLAAQEKRRR